MDNGITINSITVAETEDYGLLLILVDKPDECIDLLNEVEYVISVSDVVAIKVNGKPTELYNISSILGDHNVNILYLYSTLIIDQAHLILRSNDNEKAQNVLRDNEYEIID
jgi:hypothetical protein